MCFVGQGYLRAGAYQGRVGMDHDSADYVLGVAARCTGRRSLTRPRHNQSASRISTWRVATRKSSNTKHDDPHFRNAKTITITEPDTKKVSAITAQTPDPPINAVHASGNTLIRPITVLNRVRFQVSAIIHDRKPPA